MVVISDTSPIVNLLLIGRLDLLNAIFGNVIIPAMVDSEIRALASFDKDISSYINASWIAVVPLKERDVFEVLRFELDAGEAEAIALALEMNCLTLLIDERLGTKVAQSKGLQTIGLLGVLLKAKQKGLIPLLKPLLTDLREVAGFWLGTNLELRVLAECGE
jgi:uncharacterized protein